VDLSCFQPLLHGIGIEKRYARHDFFLIQDVLPDHLGFVTGGIFREFAKDGDGKEHNKTFCFEGDFAGSYFDPQPGRPSPVSVQALTPGSLLLIPLAEFTSRVTSEEPWLRAAHELVHSLLMKKFEREYQLLTLSARERYELLETAHPQLIREIPAFHLASYLGISPVSLSRLRGSRQKK
jgi:CRP-like cAMP-binding protein